MSPALSPTGDTKLKRNDKLRLRLRAETVRIIGSLDLQEVRGGMGTGATSPTQGCGDPSMPYVCPMAKA